VFAPRERRYLAIDSTWSPHRTIEKGNTEMIDEETIRGDRVVLAFERSGQIVPGGRSGSAYRQSNEQPSQYLHLTCISGDESGSTFKILRCNVLSYKRLAPADPHSDYDGTLFVADQGILEKVGVPLGGFWH